MERKSGISLISLIITIIVIIILAAIVIFTGLGTPDSANFARFASEFSDFNLAVDNAYMKEITDNSLNGNTRSKAQVYYKLATGIDVGINGVPNAIGTVDRLELNIMPNELEGSEYYEITSDKNIYDWKKEKQYFSENEKHYVTDEGEAFMLPGYLVQEDDGTEKWYINERLYYTGEAKVAAKLAENSAANVLEVGDYVNYIPDVKTYTPDSAKLGTSNSALSTADATWRVWSVNKITGEVMLSTELPVNPFKAVIYGRSNDISAEVDKICEELYSNNMLNIKGKRLKEEDVNKAFGYTPEWKISRTAEYSNDEDVEEGSKVVYKGEEYTVNKIGDWIYYETNAEVLFIEGGEESTDTNGLKIRKPVLGKPLYSIWKTYGYKPSDYNLVLSNAIKDDSSISGQTWLSNQKVYLTNSNEWNGMKLYFIHICDLFSISQSRTGLVNLALGSTGKLVPHTLKLTFNIRPKVILNASTLIDTADASKDGKSKETAWNFKY